MTERLRLRKDQHLRSGKDFERVYAAKISVRQPGLLVFGASNELPYSRFGLSVSRRNGSAVVRNRIKRLLREAFRLEQRQIPPGVDLILIPQAGPEPALALYREGIVRASEKLAKRLVRSKESNDATRMQNTEANSEC